MNGIDIAIITGFIVLLLVVCLRILLGRRQAAKADASVVIKKPQKKSMHAKAEAQKEVSADAEEQTRKQETTDAKTEQQEFDENQSERSLPAADTEEDTEESKELDAEDYKNPVVLIKKFSAPVEKRVKAMQLAGEQKNSEAVTALIEALYEPDSSISSAAADALGKIGDSQAIEPLLEVSRRNDAQLMREIAGTIGEENAESEENTENQEISTEIENPYNFKEMVVFKIDQLPQEYFQKDGTPIPRKDLVVKGLKDNNQQLRQMAAKVAIGLDSDDVVPPLIEALENPFEVESVRFMAAEALGGMENESSIAALIKSLKDENVAVRYSAAAALSGKKGEQVVEALVDAVNDEDKYVRSSVAYALGATRSQKAFEILFECMADESEVVRFSAAKAIACFPDDQVMKEINNRLDQADKNTKLALIEILGQIKTDESAKILRSFLNDSDGELSYKASMVLMGQENFEILDELIEASKRLDNELFKYMKTSEGAVPEGVKIASEANKKVDAQKVEEPLKKEQSPVAVTSNDESDSENDIKQVILPEKLKKLKEGLADKNPNIRGSSANALGDSKDPRAVELLVKILDDENEFVRSSAISSLGRIGDERALSYLLIKASDHSEEVRYALVKALAKFSSPSATDCLRNLADSDISSQVKRTARAALDKR
ncbi:MAG: HEAT repeat domain-containing protein [Candidatus Rifleibacteriota bacterium]